MERMMFNHPELRCADQIEAFNSINSPLTPKFFEGCDLSNTCAPEFR
jgi:hypothetical protein